MNNPVNRIDKVLKTKEDLQGFILLAFILFVLFVKCYMIITTPKVGSTSNSVQNTNIVKTTSVRNI